MGLEIQKLVSNLNENNLNEVDVEVARVIAENDGDLYQTIKVLLIANAYLEVARASAVSKLSYGFVRGKVAAFPNERM